MKTIFNSSIIQQESLKTNQSIFKSEKVCLSDSTTFPVKTILKRSFELKSTDNTSFTLDCLLGIEDISKVCFVHIDIQNQTDDAFTNTVEKFALTIGNTSFPQLSHFELLNIEGITGPLFIDGVSISTNSTANLVVNIGIK